MASDAKYIGIRVLSAENGEVADIIPYSRPRTENESEKVLRGTLMQGNTDKYLFEEVESERELAEADEDKFIVRGTVSGAALTHPADEPTARRFLTAAREAEIDELREERERMQKVTVE